MTVLQRIEAPGCGCDAPAKGDAPIGIDEALRRIARAAAPVEGTERVALERALGRVLAAPVRSRAASPRFDNAAMDGYALDASALAGDGPWTLRVAARLPAGRAPAAPLASGTAARIFTGAPTPEGADAVVMQEEACRVGDAIRLDRRPAPGDNLRRAGSELAAGETILAAGRRLGPREIAACAAAGAGSVLVRRRLRVGLLVTGDEVRRAGETLGAARIWDVNTPMLRAALTGPSVALAPAALAADDRAGLRRQLAEMAGRVDLLVTTGGISVGEEDHVKPALRDLGAETLFGGVAIKPGKPVSCARLGDAFWLGLPGNPLSALVTWNLFGTALSRRLTGRTDDGPARRHVVTARAVRRRPGRCEFRPARLVGFDALGREVAAFEDATYSDRVARLPDADGLALLPAEVDALPQGALVEFLPFDAG